MEARRSLMEHLMGLGDARRKQGQRHPLPAILALVVVASISGMRSLEGIVQFGNEHGRPLLLSLGFTRRKAPSKPTLSRVLRQIDVKAFEAIVATWMREGLGRDAGRHIAIDGKTLRGTREGEVPAVHLLAAYDSNAKAVLDQVRVTDDGKGNEYTAALERLRVVPIRGKVVTGDAMFIHKELCDIIVSAGGDYVLTVKGNQPTLLEEIRTVFEPPAGLSPP